jgi:hypothetical protein
MKKINNTRKKEIKRRRRAAELLNAEMKIKYPKNSMICFESKRNKGEEIKTVSCCWYNKVGRPDGKLPNRKDHISKPPEWQNIPYEEAKKIAEMFDKNMFLNLHYV